MEKLSKEFLKKNYQAIFNTTPHDSRSEKYVHVSTEKIVDDMERLGWFPYQVKCLKTRKRSAETVKHIVMFFNPELEGEEITPTIMLLNSHDGTTSVRFEAGIFRLVCTNGLVIKTEDMGSFKMRHMGYSFEDLRVGIYKIVERIPNAISLLIKLREKTMSENEQREFAKKAIEARFGEEKVLSEDEFKNFVKPIRDEDEGNNVWVVFNKIQEKLTHGDFRYKAKNKKGEFIDRKARAIKNFQQDVDMNQKLWELAESYV